MSKYGHSISIDPVMGTCIYCSVPTVIYVLSMCYLCVIYVLSMCYLCVIYVLSMCYLCVIYVVYSAV